jgi:hypothetical protein
MKIFGTPRCANPAERTETKREDVPENTIMRLEAVREVNVKIAGSWTATPFCLFWLFNDTVSNSYLCGVE